MAGDGISRRVMMACACCGTAAGLLAARTGLGRWRPTTRALT